MKQEKQEPAYRRQAFLLTRRSGTLRRTLGADLHTLHGTGGIAIRYQ